MKTQKPPSPSCCQSKQLCRRYCSEISEQQNSDTLCSCTLLTKDGGCCTACAIASIDAKSGDAKLRCGCQSCILNYTADVPVALASCMVGNAILQAKQRLSKKLTRDWNILVSSRNILKDKKKQECNQLAKIQIQNNVMKLARDGDYKTRWVFDWCIGDDHLFRGKVKVCKAAFAAHYGCCHSTIDNIIKQLKDGKLFQNKAQEGEEKDNKAMKQLMQKDAELWGIELSEEQLAFVTMPVASTVRMYHNPYLSTLSLHPCLILPLPISK